MSSLPQQQERNRIQIKLSARSLAMLAAVFAVGFLVGRVHVSDGIWPFGPAYVLAAFLNARQINPYVALGGVLTALCSCLLQMEHVAFRFAVTVLCAVLMIAATFARLPMTPKIALLAAAVAYAASTIAFKLTLVLYVISSLIELAVCGFMVLVLNKVIRLCCERGRRTVLTDEELISIGFVSILAVLGLGKINVGGVYLRNIAAIYVSLTAAMLGGAAAGAAVGLAVGLAAMLGGADPGFMANVAACALVAGLLKRLKRPLVALGFVLMNAILTYYLNYSTFVIIPLIDTLIAASAFVLTPRRAMEFLGKYVDANLMRVHEQRLHLDRFRELTVGRLKEISQVFLNASDVFAGTTDKRTGIAFAISGIPERACARCLFYSTCWDADFEKTVAVMQRLYAKFEKNHSIGERDLGQVFLKRCVHPGTLMQAAREVFREYETNRRWEEKVMESRSVVGEQLRGVSRIIDTLGQEVQADLEFKEEMEEQIRRNLDEVGLTAKEVCADLTGGSLHVDLKMKGCGGQGACRGKVRQAVSAACGANMCKTAEAACAAGRMCTLRYEQAKKFGLHTGTATAIKEGSTVSGDSYSNCSLRDGRYMLLLCDGMGSGERAARESGAAVSLMEDFYRAGFDDQTILNAINKLLLLSSSDDVYSTMDLCMVNLQTGMAKFTKIGAPHSYLVSGNSVRKLSAGALPLGVLDDFAPREHEAELKPGDVIIMFSDGIADLENVSDGVFEGIIEATHLRNVQEMAETILALALAAYGGVAKDDMTVMVSRVVKTGRAA